MRKILLILFLLLFSLPIIAKEYGTNRYIYENRYVVNCEVLNVRTAPRTGSVMFTIRKGDYVYGKILDSNWFQINGGDWYIFSKYITKESNPYFGKKVDQKEDQVDIAFTYKIQKIVRWGLLVLCIIAFIIGIVCTRGLFKELLLKMGLCENGMRKKYYYDSKSYLSIVLLIGLIIVAIIAGILTVLLVGGAAWLVMAICWLLLWALIVIGWILVIGGIGYTIGWWLSSDLKDKGCLLGILAVIAIIVGRIISNYTDDIIELGNSALDSGFGFFKHFYIVDFVQDLFILYWQPVAIIAATPLVLFFILVLINLVVSCIFMLVQYIVMARYNIKNPCPMCQHASEPAIYLSDNEELPVALHPGKYGIFTVQHPTTMKKLSTMLFNGKGKLSRKCKHCGAIISADMGTEKHIALAGVTESGKTTLVYRMIASMFNIYSGEIDFTDDFDDNTKTYIKEISKMGYVSDFPNKTPVGQMRSIQLRLARNMGMNYRLFINDVGGELYRMSGVDGDSAKQIAQFVRNMNTIVFIVDPMTIDFSDCELSKQFSKWVNENQSENIVKVNIAEAFSRLKQLMESQHLSSKAISRINMNVVFVKKDLAYLSDLQANDSESLKCFMQSDMGLHSLVDDIGSTFNIKHINYTAVSAIKKDTKNEDSGNVDDFVSTLLLQLGINYKV